MPPGVREQWCARGPWVLRLVLGLAAWLLVACVPPPGPMERLTNSAYDLNTASRFGRLDVAMAYVEPGERLEYARRHAQWGRGLRVVDVDLVSIQPVAEDVVDVHVVVSWHRLDEMTMKQSQVAQRWKNSEDDWQLVEEQRVAGDRGLFVPKRVPARKRGAAAEPPAAKAPPKG